ncbi:DnaJ chaperone [Piedraia hortae CBS 480.64]|uniref:DnaJ chaperone n=1 Tax=Piedraia hortae CBS 480.64 TaxID=1314780 RepID=A0A6A7C892_9PEZI|nr:DnaJ chaperone [Piedraia hortae CBS 480.64]
MAGTFGSSSNTYQSNVQTEDYYTVLGVSPDATAQQIREGYKRAALRHHPDRVAADSPERPARTKRFQQVNDAYYTLSDASRRRQYDATRTMGGGSFPFSGGFGEGSSADAGPSANSGFAFPWGFFGSGGRSQEQTREEKDQFASVFEEMMRDEGLAEGEEARPTRAFWSIIGGLSGAVMGFILANMPGMIAGGVAGNRLGAVRDKRGKSVYSVYQELEQPEKMRLLSELATKVFAHAIS